MKIIYTVQRVIMGEQFEFMEMIGCFNSEELAQEHIEHLMVEDHDNIYCMVAYQLNPEIKTNQKIKRT